MELPESQPLVGAEQREAGAAQVAPDQDRRVRRHRREWRPIGARRPSRVRESQPRPHGLVDRLSLCHHLTPTPDEVDGLRVQPPQFLNDLGSPNVHHATLTGAHGVEEAVHPVGIVAEVRRGLGEWNGRRDQPTGVTIAHARILLVMWLQMGDEHAEVTPTALSAWAGLGQQCARWV